MPKARIITRFPERAAALRKTLKDSGYHVEVVPPECDRTSPADLEYELDDATESAAIAPITAPQREFILAPRLRAIKERFAKRTVTEDRAGAATASGHTPTPSFEPKAAGKPMARPSAVARIKAQLPVLLARSHKSFDQLSKNAASAYASAKIWAEGQRSQLESTLARRRAEAAGRREAERVAAERSRAEQALRTEERRRREAERMAQLQAQMEVRRKQAEAAAEQGRREAEECKRREAEERVRLEAERVLKAKAEPSLPVEVHPLRRRSTDQPQKSKLPFSDWRDLQPSVEFANTRQYAWRQAVPAAAGLALAFILGWAIAMGPRKEAAPVSAQSSASPVAAVGAFATAPVTASRPSSPQASKPAATKQRTTAVSRSRDFEEEVDEDGQEEVIVRHHYPSKGKLAGNGRQKTVKTISDLDEN